MEKDQEIIQEYFTKYYPVKKKYIYNEMDIASIASGAAGVGMLGIIIMIFLLLVRKSNVVTGEVSDSISNPNKYRQMVKNQEELQGELKDSPLDDKSKKEYSQNLNEITKLREEIKKLQEERKQETEQFKRFFEKIKSKEIDKDNILSLIQSIMESGDPDEIKQKLEEIKKEVEESKLSKDEINEIEGYIEKVESNVKKEQGLLSKIAQKIKDFCMGSFETVSSLMKSGGKKVKEGLSKFWGKVTSTFGGFFDKKLDMALNNINDSLVNGKNILLKVSIIDFKIKSIDVAKNINEANFIYLYEKNVLIIHNNEGFLQVSNNIDQKKLEDIISNEEITRSDFKEFNETLESQVAVGDRSVPISIEEINPEEVNKQKTKIKFTLSSDPDKRGMIDIFQDIEEDAEFDGNYIHFPISENYDLLKNTKQYKILDKIDFVELIKNYDQEFEYNVEYVEIEDEEQKDEEESSSSNSIIDDIKSKIKEKSKDVKTYITNEEIKIKALIDDTILDENDLVKFFEEKDIKNTSDDLFDDPFGDLDDNFDGEEDFLGPDPLDNNSEKRETTNESFKNKKLNSILNEMFYSDIKRTHKFYFEEVNMQEPIEVTKKAGKKIVITHKFPQIIKIKDLNEFEPSNVYKINLQDNEIEKIISLKDFNLKNHFNSIILYQYEGNDIHIGQLIINFNEIGENELIYENILKYFNEKVSEIASVPVTEAKMSRDDLKKFLAANPVEIKINDNFLNEIKFEILRKGEISSKKIKENEKAEEIIKDLAVAKQELEKKNEEELEDQDQEQAKDQKEDFQPIKFDLETFLTTTEFKKSDKDELILTKEKENYFLNFNVDKEKALKLKKSQGFITKIHPDKNRNGKEILLEKYDRTKTTFKVPVTIIEPKKEGEKRKIFISEKSFSEIFAGISIPDPIKTNTDTTKTEQTKKDATPTADEKLKIEDQTKALEDGTKEETKALEDGTKEEVVSEDVSGFIRTNKDKAIMGTLINRDKIKTTISSGNFDVYYYIKAEDNILYYEVNEDLLAILVMIKKSKKIKHNNFSSTFELSNVDFITSDYSLLKKVFNMDINKIKQKIKEIKKIDNVSFGTGELIDEGNVKKVKFPTSNNLKPKIKNSGNQQLQLPEPKEVTQDSYVVKNLDSVIINEVFKKWKK
jgi:hypothetical protein